jgi:hypothetical protein
VTAGLGASQGSTNTVLLARASQWAAETRPGVLRLARCLLKKGNEHHIYSLAQSTYRPGGAMGVRGLGFLCRAGDLHHTTRPGVCAQYAPEVGYVACTLVQELSYSSL